MHTLLAVDHGTTTGLFCPSNLAVAQPTATGPKVILCADWRDVISTINSTYGAQLASGELTGLWLGDEIEAPFTNWTAVLRALRASLGPKPLLYTNEDRLFEGTGCDFPAGGSTSMAAQWKKTRSQHLVCQECRWPHVPPELSLISIDSCKSTSFNKRLLWIY